MKSIIMRALMPFAGFFFVVVFFLLIPGYANAGAGSCVALTPDDQFQYATRCFEEREYSIAIAEFKRFIHFFPDDPRIETARYQIGMCYFNLREYASAVFQFSGLLNSKNPTETGIDSGFMISACYRGLKDYPAAINNLHALAGLTEDPNTRDRVFYNLGLLYLESKDFENARVFFNRISHAHRAQYQAEAAVARLDDAQRIPRKSPVIAGLASIVPGGGYLYCKRYRDALFAFLINSALICAAVEGFDDGYYSLGGLLAAVEAGFYAGNIYGGVSSAHKYNQAREGEFVVDFIKGFGFDLSAGGNAEGFILGVSCRF